MLRIPLDPLPAASAAPILTWLSFSFYDRVQSGQLISRANSDIRSVQMYSIFAPLIIVQCFIGVVAFGFMLSINWALALISMVVMIPSARMERE